MKRQIFHFFDKKVLQGLIKYDTFLVERKILL